MPALTDFDEEILEIISVKQPIKAIHIANILSIKQETNFRRTDINRRLYNILRVYVEQDEFFQWSLWKEEGGRSTEGDLESDEGEEGTVNLDSTVTLGCSNGQVLRIEFTKYKVLRFEAPKPGITYAYFMSPLALSIMGKRVGDICDLPGALNKILEID